MPEPVATAAVAAIEFTMVRHWFFSLMAILVFTIWCFMCDNREMDEHKRPFTTLMMLPLVLLGGLYLVVMEECFGIKNPIGNRPRTVLTRWVTATCRVYAKNVRLFFRLIFGALLLISVAGAAVAILRPKSKPLPSGGGPESEKFFGFMNTITAPLQWIVNSIRFLLGILSVVWLVTVYYAGKVLAISPVVTLTAIVVVYFVWLWFTTRRIVSEEFGSKGTVAHAIVALVPAQLTTWLLFFVSLGAIESAFAWICSQIPA